MRLLVAAWLVVFEMKHLIMKLIILALEKNPYKLDPLVYPNHR